MDFGSLGWWSYLSEYTVWFTVVIFVRTFVNMEFSSWWCWLYLYDLCKCRVWFMIVMIASLSWKKPWEKVYVSQHSVKLLWQNNKWSLNTRKEWYHEYYLSVFSSHSPLFYLFYKLLKLIVIPRNNNQDVVLCWQVLVFWYVKLCNACRVCIASKCNTLFGYKYLLS